MFYQHYAPLGLMRYISGKALLYMQHFDTLDQRNARTHISHIALLASLKNLVIGNGGSTFYVRLHGGCTFLITLSISHYCMLHSFTSFDAFGLLFKVCKSSLSCFSNPHS